MNRQTTQQTTQQPETAGRGLCPLALAAVVMAAVVLALVVTPPVALAVAGCCGLGWLLSRFVSV